MHTQSPETPPLCPPLADEIRRAAADFEALTAAQYRFLLTFVPDLRPGEGAESATQADDAQREAFVDRVLGMDFDGCETDKTLRVARNLNRKGFFDQFEEHAGGGLMVMLSRRGAQLLFNVLESWSQ